MLESATSLARKIRKRELKSEEVVRAFIDRIHQVNKLLNAVVDERFDEAIEDAQNLDKEIAEGKITDIDFEKKPFLGESQHLQQNRFYLSFFRNSFYYKGINSL